MPMTFVQAFEDQDAALKAEGFLVAKGYQVYVVDGTDMADLRGLRADGSKPMFSVGELDDKKVYVVLGTMETVRQG